MYASIPDALRALARKIGADANGRNEEEILNNIVVKLGGTPIRNHGVAGSVAALTSVVDIDDMHVLTTKTVTANGTYTASDDDADGYSSVTVNVATPVPETYAVAINVPESGDPTINHTYAEIASAFNSGKSIIGEVNYYGYEQPLNIVYSFKDDIRYTATGTDVVLTDAIVLQTNCFDIVGQNMPSAFLTFIVAQYQGTDGILLVMNMFAN